MPQIPDLPYITTLAFSFMADIEEAKQLTKDKSEIQESCLDKFKKALNDKVIIDKIGEWECNHLPWITIYNQQEQNLTTFFEHKTENILVIAVAGTNFTSNFDWFIEDLETANLVPWNKEIVKNGAKNTGPDENGSVSVATAKALYNTWTQEIETGENPQETPIDYLKARLSELLNSELLLVVTGHSLGGAIAPVLAQAIADNIEDWDLDGADVSNLRIVTYPFAGPTPGDEQFVEYVTSNEPRKVKAEVKSTFNRNDVVPHAWMLEQPEPGDNYPIIPDIPTLFESVLSPEEGNDVIVKETVHMLQGLSEKAKSNGHTYMRWPNENEVTGDLKKLSNEEWGAAEGLAIGIREHVKIEKYAPVKNALYKITGLPSSAEAKELDFYLSYFSKFLLHLAIQHINAYSDKVIADEDFSKALSNDINSAFFDPIAMLKKLEEGLSILDELFLKVAEQDDQK